MERKEVLGNNFWDGVQWVLLVYIFLRSLGVFLVAFSIFGAAVSYHHRVGVAGVVACCLGFSLPVHSVEWSLSSGCAEVFIGALLGFPLLLLYQGARMFGEFFDAGRGQTIGAFYDPLSGVSGQLMAECIGRWVCAELLVVGLLPQFVEVLFISSDVVPPGTLSLDQLFAFPTLVMRSFVHSYTIAMLVFLLVGGGFLLVDLFSGFVSRLLPRFHIHGEIFLVRSLLGFVLLFWFIQCDVHLSFFAFSSGSANTVLSVIERVAGG
jgi:flagellar biosynthesis protein FliR